MLLQKSHTHHLPVLLLPLLLFLSSRLYWMSHFGLFLLLPFSAVLPPDWYSLLQHLWFLLLPVFLFQHLGKSHLLLPALFLWYRQSLHRLLQCPLQYLPKHPHLRTVSRSRQILPVFDPLQARPVFPSALLPESLQCFHCSRFLPVLFPVLPSLLFLRSAALPLRLRCFLSVLLFPAYLLIRWQSGS